MMLSDAPRYVSGRSSSGKSGGPVRDDRSAEEEAEEIAGFFRSRLGQ